MDGSATLTLREKLARKSLDVVDETRARMAVKKKTNSQGLGPKDT